MEKSQALLIENMFNNLLAFYYKIRLTREIKIKIFFYNKNLKIKKN